MTTAQDITWYNTTDNVFNISTEEHLKGLAQLVNNEIDDFSGKTINLTADIALTSNHTPIGDNSTTAKQFKGTFNGNNKTISNLSVSGVDYAGLFGYVGAGGQIKDIAVNVANISSATYAGGLAGYYASIKTIENCKVTISGKISASASTNFSYQSPHYYVHYEDPYQINVTWNESESSDCYSGGLVGYVNQTIVIKNSYSIGDISSSISAKAISRFGGCSSTGSHSRKFYVYVSAYVNAYVGGLVGYANQTLTISNSYSNSNISASSQSNSDGSMYASVGENRYCYATCYPFSWLGGLVGWGNITINNSYSIGSISVNDVNSTSIYSDLSDSKPQSYCGGLIGYSSDKTDIVNSYSSKTINETGKGTRYSGGILGNWSSGTNNSVYHNSDETNNTAGQGEPTGILGMTAEQLKKQGTFFNWDFDYIWAIDEDVSYPSLIEWKWFNKIGVLGLEEQYEYTGNSIKPKLDIQLQENGMILKKDVDYIISYDENRNVSTGGTIVVAGMGDYDGTISEIINFSITPKELTVSEAMAQNKIYDGTTLAKIEVEEINGLIDGDDVFVKDTVGNFLNKSVGTEKTVIATLTLTGIDAENYKLTQPIELIADITKKVLVISLDPKIYSIAPSDDIPNFAENLSYTGFAEGDTKDVITGTTKVNFNYLKGNSPMGNYPLTLSGALAAANYEISFDNSDLMLIIDDGTSVNNIEKINLNYGIKFTNSIVYDKAEISVILPNSEKTAQTKVIVYDAIGNVVFENTTRNDTILWDLTNKTGKFVANGSYLVVAEVKSVKGITYHYSAKLGVKK